MSLVLFRVGDRVKCVDRNSGNFGKSGTVTRIDYENHIVYSDGCTGCGQDDYYKKVNEKSIMQKVSTMMRKLLDADTQVLVKAGYINGDLELTDEGVSALNTVLFTANKAALVALAQEKIDEEKANK